MGPAARGCGHDTVTSSNTIPPSSGSANDEEEEVVSGTATNMACTNTTATDAPEECEDVKTQNMHHNEIQMSSLSTQLT